MYRCWFCGSWDAISFANLCPFHIRCAIRCAHKKEGRREHRDGGRRPLGHSRIPLRTAMSRRGTPRLNERKARALPSDQRIAALPTQHTQESYSLAPVSRLFERALDCVARQARLARWKRLGKGPAPQWRRARGSRKADEIGLAPRRLRCLRLIPMTAQSRRLLSGSFLCVLACCTDEFCSKQTTKHEPETIPSYFANFETRTHNATNFKLRNANPCV